MVTERGGKEANMYLGKELSTGVAEEPAAVEEQAAGVTADGKLESGPQLVAETAKNASVSVTG
jgi:hypothetical protein